MRRALLALLVVALVGCANPDAPGEDAPAPLIAPTRAEASAEAAETGALGMGDLAPDFVLPDAHGERVRLGDVLSDGPVVLTFYRGSWCPYCNQSLQSFQEALPDIEAAGAQLIAISPNTPAGAAEMEQTNTLTFPVLSDVGNLVSREYGLVYEVSDEVRNRYRLSGIDLAEANGVDAWELPVPATYVIAPDGTIRFAFVEADYTLRASPRDVVAALYELG